MAGTHSFYLERTRFVDFTIPMNEDVGYFVIGRRGQRTYLSFFDKVGMGWGENRGFSTCGVATQK